MSNENLHHEGERAKFFEVSADRCSATIPKGGSAEKTPSHVMVMDTGQPWVPEMEKREPKTPEEADELYRETIRRGIIDHHGIDAVVKMPEGALRRCATKMVADFSAEVLKVIKQRDVSSVTAHLDSDLDSIASTYLVKALIQSGDAEKMPKITQQLGEFVNFVDYGRYDESDPQKYVKSLLGLFGSVKRVLQDRQSAKMKAIWSDESKALDVKRREAGELVASTSQELVERSIELLNACERLATEKGSVNLRGLEMESLSVSSETKAMLEKGTTVSLEEIKKFDAEFERAERGIATVKIKDGRTLEVPTILFTNPDLSPLQVTNLCYQRMPQETIVAVYAGADRKYGGDAYDIGIKPETADIFDLKTLEIPLNDTEESARKNLFPNLDALVSGALQPTQEQQRMLDRWRTNPKDLSEKWKVLRKGFEHTNHGDPSVVVAGGSLLAASNTSLLDAETFKRTVKETLGMIG